jgi:hypothetical protein
MKAIIHIGTEKTGTTTIQEFLHENREALKSRGIGFLHTPGLRNQRLLAVYAMNDKQTDDFIVQHDLSSPQKKREWNNKFKTTLYDEIRKLDKSIHTVIFSSEHLHSRLKSESAMQRLKDLLSPWFNEVDILIYIRRQDQVAASAYSTKLKAGATPDQILNLKVGPENPYYNYYHQLQKWSSIFGKGHINIRLFEPEKFYNNNLIADFLTSTGINESEQWFLPEKLNEKLSWRCQRLLHRYNRKHPKFDENGYNELNDKVRTKLLTRLETRYPGQGELPTQKEAISFYNKFREDNRLLAREYLGEDHLFSEDFSEYPERKPGYKLTSVDILFFEIMVKLEQYKQSRLNPID